MTCKSVRARQKLVAVKKVANKLNVVERATVSKGQVQCHGLRLCWMTLRITSVRTAGNSGTNHPLITSYKSGGCYTYALQNALAYIHQLLIKLVFPQPCTV